MESAIQPIKPFLLIQSRPETAASDNEYEAFLQCTGLKPQQLKRIRAELTPLPEIRLDDLSGIIIGGGPFNASDPEQQKSPAQRRLEKDLHALLDRVIERDFPFLGACYGIGIVTLHQNGIVSKKYAEPVGPTTITLTHEGISDPLLAHVTQSFQAFVGHKEACEVLPTSATLLASSKDCPVQMYRIKNNVYITQFHPELDADGLETRINIYKHAGYFPPETAEELIAAGHKATVTEPEKIARNFATLYAQLAQP